MSSDKEKMLLLFNDYSVSINRKCELYDIILQPCDPRSMPGGGPTIKKGSK